jgi:protease-4
MRSAIQAVRKAGKPVEAWLRTPGTREYYLATAADKIYLAEEDILYVKGFRAELSFFKGTLDKLGVAMEVETAGRYKDAGDIFSRSSATPETREVVNSMLDRVYGMFVEAVAGGRGKKAEEVRALIDDGPFLAAKAVSAGLIDGTRYEDQFMDGLAKRAGEKDLEKVALRAYARDAIASSGRGARIALIAGTGAIARGGSGGMNEDSLILSDDFIKLLRQASKDPEIRGAIVRVDSPGGDAIASDDILREMKLLSKAKPTVISMSDVAASGGYYIAATGDPIVAYPGTITGSIGVVFTKPNMKGLYDKIGVTKESIDRGRNAGIDSDYGPMTPAAREKLREGIKSTYDAFLVRVAEARKRKVDEIEPLAQGRVWMGTDAHQNKLVDALGGLDKAVELVKERAKIGKDERVRLIPYPPKRSFITRLLGAEAPALAEAQVRAWMKQRGMTLPPAMVPEAGLMRAMPYSIEIR